MKAQPKHTAFRDDLVAVLKKHDLTAPEMLALAAHLTGQLVALQDQTTMTPERAMDIVAANLELGNQAIIGDLLASKGVA
jgi:hypothetical protein